MGAVPDRLPPGRAIASESDLEVQFALLTEDPSAPAQWAALHRGALRAAGHVPGASGPIVVRPLPARVTAGDCRSAGAAASPLGGQSRLQVLGLGHDDASPVHVDLSGADRRFLVAGPPRSGRSSTLVCLADQVKPYLDVLTVVAATRSPASDWARSCGVPVLHPLTDTVMSDVYRMAEFGEGLVVIDDAEQLSQSPLADALARLAQRPELSILASIRTEDLALSFRGIAADLRRSRTGLLLQPASGDGELFGVRTAAPVAALPPGRGVLVTDRSRALDPCGVRVQVTAPAGAQ
jgi:S-DNA-T family DNA segregation ATPase FtsK/SpoIIIE